MKNILSFTCKNAQKSELLRYFFIGGLCALFDIALLYLFVAYLHIWYLSATTISFSIVTFSGYFGQKYFTFRDLSKNHKRQISFFFVVAGTGLVINTGLMFFLVSFLGAWYIAANIITKILVFIWNYSANRHITFEKSF